MDLAAQACVYPEAKLASWLRQLLLNSSRDTWLLISTSVKSVGKDGISFRILTPTRRGAIWWKRLTVELAKRSSQRTRSENFTRRDTKVSIPLVVRRAVYPIGCDNPVNKIQSHLALYEFIPREKWGQKNPQNDHRGKPLWRGILADYCYLMVNFWAEEYEPIMRRTSVECISQFLVLWVAIIIISAVSWSPSEVVMSYYGEFHSVASAVCI